MWLATVVLLTISNIFMTFAWYGHLKFKEKALWIVILASWGIAFWSIAFRCRPTASAERRRDHRATEDHPGGDYAERVLRLLGAVSWGAAEVELLGRLWADLRGGVFVFAPWQG